MPFTPTTKTTLGVFELLSINGFAISTNASSIFFAKNVFTSSGLIFLSNFSFANSAVSFFAAYGLKLAIIYNSS